MAKFLKIPFPNEIAEQQKRYEDNLRYVQDLVNSHLGEPVLVVEHREGTGGCTGFGGRGQLEVNTSYSLAVPEQKATVNKSSLIIPASHYAQRGDRYRDAWSLRDGAISLDCLMLLSLNDELENPMPGTPGKSLDDLEQSLEVYAGNREVTLCFSFRKMEHEEARAETSKLGKAEFDDYIRKRGHPDTSYIDALKLLGREAPAPFKEELLKGKQEIVRRILKEEYSGKVSSKLLEEAVKLDMHREPLKFNNGNGVTVDVPTYVAELCVKYKIEMPK